MSFTPFRFMLVLFMTFWLSVMPTAMASDVSKSLTQIGLEKGLSQGEVTTLLQDHEGFIWIGTYQGLNLFDGYQIRQIEGKDKTLQVHLITSLYQDKNKLIWVGTSPDRNFVINKSTGNIRDITQVYPEGFTTLDSGFSKIIPGDNNDLWLLTYQSIFNVNLENIDVDADSPIVVDDLRLDFSPWLGEQDGVRTAIQLGSFLFIGASNGLFRLDIESGTVVPIQFLKPKPNTDGAEQLDDRLNVKGLTSTSQDKLLISTVEGLYQIEQKYLMSSHPTEVSRQIEVLEPELNIWQVMEEKDFLWLATNDGLFQLKDDSKLLKVRYSDTTFPIFDDNIQAMIRDNQGNLWLSSRNDGAFIWKPNVADFVYFQEGTKANDLSNNMIWGIKQDAKTNVWVATDNGLNKINSETNEVDQLFVNPDPKARTTEATIYDIEIQRDEIWLAKQNGITRINATTNAEIKALNSDEVNELFSEPAYDLSVLDDNRLMVLNAKGIFVYDSINNTVEANEQNNPDLPWSEQLYRVLHHDKSENNLLISKSDQLVRYSLKTGQLEVVHSLPPAEKPRTTPEGVYTDNKLTWISYPGFGIYVIDNITGEEMAHLTTENGLPDDTPYNLFSNDDQFVWAISNSGLARISKDNFHVRVFQSQHGFSSNEFNSGAVLIDSNGQFWLGGVKGINVFDPNTLINSNNERNTIHNHITSINLLSRPIQSRFGAYYDHEVHLNHDDFGLELTFSALHYANLSQLKYQYWLEGAAQTPPKVISTNHLLLPKLEVGKSIIKISAIDYETGQASEAESLTIIVSPAPHLSAGAFTLYFAVIAAIITAFYLQYRTKREVMATAHAELQASEERLQLALTGGGSGMWEWLSSTNLVYDPRVGDQQQGHFVPLSEKFKHIHQEDLEQYNARWQQFISSRKEVFEAVYRMKVDNKWRWFKDLARATKQGSSGNAKRVSGTYTDISEIKANQDKITLFSEAFQATRDSVVITDDHLNVLDANNAFFVMSGFKPENVIGKTPSFIFGERQDMELLTKIVFNLMAHDAWEGEANLACSTGEPVPVIVNTTKFKTSNNETHFVFALTDIFKQKVAEAELKRQANYDSLTGLPNRVLLSDRINHAMIHHKMADEMFAICFIDLDNFKQINDTLGHDVGDELLKEVAAVLQSSVREYDSVARLGGDEFVLVIEELKSLDVIHRIAQKIIDAMAEMPFAANYPIKTSPSIGIATFPADGTSSQELMKNADMAMYHAKRLGRNNFQFFEDKMNEDAHAKLTLENEIEQAIEQNEFTLVYQPKINLSTGQICGFEALARWTKADGEMIPPGVFIPVLEEMGLIIQLTEQLLEIALDDLKIFLQQDPSLSVALNFSAKHLQNYDLPSYLESRIKQKQIPPKHLEIELTETVLMEDIETALAVCDRISALGFNIALDDFGTGYSSFKYLSQLPINTLKIDRSFVWNIGDEQGDTIIDSILGLAKKLGISVVAEGIETKEQFEFLRNLECKKGQGYLFARPVPIEDCLALLKAHKTYCS